MGTTTLVVLPRAKRVKEQLSVATAIILELSASVTRPQRAFEASECRRRWLEFNDMGQEELRTSLEVEQFID